MGSERRHFNHGPKFMAGTWLQYVRECACGKSGPPDIAIAFLCQKNDDGTSTRLPDLLRCFNSVEVRHSHVEKYNVRNQCGRFLDCFQPIPRFADNSKRWNILKN